jgi:hypothetical protein
MTLLAENEAALAFLSGNQSLISSSVESFLIRGPGQVTIDVVFRLMYSKTVKKVLLRFDQVSAYAFYHSREYSFYNVETYKLLKVETGFYLSLDPYDETPVIDERDNDFIRATGLEVFEVKSD